MLVSWLDSASNKAANLYRNQTTATGAHRRWLAPEDLKDFGSSVTNAFSIFGSRHENMHGSIPDSHVLQLAYDTKYTGNSSAFNWEQLNDIATRDTFIFLNEKHFYPVIRKSNCIDHVYYALSKIADDVLEKIRKIS